mmetsp:Transcript_127395/g.224326  ORF Transcript_127395/g.224326 Transcript_127395/m.224326 type:complete len:452 (+) Transcript_127395:115-1470(+)
MLQKVPFGQRETSREISQLDDDGQDSEDYDDENEWYASGRLYETKFEFWKEYNPHTWTFPCSAEAQGAQGLLKTLCMDADDHAILARRVALEAFMVQGAWSKYPGALMVRFDLRSLGPVNVVEGTFDAAGVLHMWYQTAKPEHMDWQHRPQIRFRNAAGGEKAFANDTSQDLHFKEVIPGTGLVSWSTEVLGSFKTAFSLSEFPFDVQDCSIIMSVSTSLREDRQALFAGSSVPMNDQQFWLPVQGLTNVAVHLPEWDLLTPKMFVQVAEGGAKMIFRMSFRLKRKYTHFVISIMMPVGVITNLAFMCFLVPSDEIDDRSGITIALVLTAVMFNQTVSDNIPNIGYMTLLDKYVNFSFFFIIFICFENTLVALLHRFELLDDESIRTIDNWTACGMAAVWFLANVFIILRINLYLAAVRRNCGSKQAQVMFGAQSPRDEYDLQNLIGKKIL